MISFSSITVANKIVQNGIQHATMYMCTTEVCPYSFGPQEIKNNFHLLYAMTMILVSIPFNYCKSHSYTMHGFKD